MDSRALPAANRKLREQLEPIQRSANCSFACRRSIRQRRRRSTGKIARRVIRAVEICLLTGEPVSRNVSRLRSANSAQGIFVFRDRESFTSESIAESK